MIAKSIVKFILATAVAAFVAAPAAFADTKERVVIQVSDDNPKTWGQALNVVRNIQNAEGKMLAAADIDSDVSFLFGGQIKGGRLRLFMIYSAGNFIECTIDTPYLQIGEHKYGKPVLDRAISFDTDLYDALKIGLISMDSTMRSNLGVGLPIDILVVRRDTCNAEVNYRIEAGEPYFQDLRERWSGALRAAHMAIPRPPYRSPG